MQARYYDPVIVRFYSNDPVGYTSESPVMSFNRYLYVDNNPYKYVDPDGEFKRQILRFLKDPIRRSRDAYKSIKRELIKTGIIDTPLPPAGSPVYQGGDAPVITGRHDGKGGITPLEDNDPNQYDKEKQKRKSDSDSDKGNKEHTKNKSPSNKGKHPSMSDYLSRS
jgi:hypothetical protein